MPIFHDDKGGSTFGGTMGAAMSLHNAKAKEADKSEESKESDEMKKSKGHKGDAHDHLHKAKEHIEKAVAAMGTDKQSDDTGEDHANQGGASIASKLGMTQ